MDPKNVKTELNPLKEGQTITNKNTVPLWVINLSCLAPNLLDPPVFMDILFIHNPQTTFGTQTGWQCLTLSILKLNEHK
jgi:hypothetical protein